MKTKTVAVLLTVVLGLAAGTAVNNYANMDIDTTLNSIKYSIPGQGIVSEDPDLEAFSNPDVPESVSNYSQLRAHNASAEVGPWRGVEWSYAPPRMFDSEMEGSVLTRNVIGKSNIYQFMRLPEVDSQVVMRARNPANALGVETGDCTTSRGFVEMRLWDGPIPVEGAPHPRYAVSGSKIQVNTSFGQSPSKLTMDVPDSYEGKKAVFFGGLLPVKECNGTAATMLEVDELYIDAG